ncbi:putative glycerol uptake facilitator protein, partial [Smittium culicis]
MSSTDLSVEERGSKREDSFRGNSEEKMRIFGVYNQRYRFRKYLAEFFGTAILIFFGTSVVATVTFNPAFEAAKWVIISMGWGFGLIMALYVSMGVSGGHLNPAITIASAVYGRFPLNEVAGYIFSQVLGAFLGAALTYGVFRGNFSQEGYSDKTLSGQYATGGIFATYPSPTNSTWDSFYTEMLLTALLALIVQSMFDSKMTPAKGFEPIAVGLIVFTIGICAGTTTGYAINPARDF